MTGQPSKIGSGLLAITVLSIGGLGASAFDDDDRTVPDDAIHAGIPAPPDSIDFNRDVRPILVARCYACHGPDISTRKLGLRLDTR